MKLNCSGERMRGKKMRQEIWYEYNRTGFECNLCDLHRWIDHRLWKVYTHTSVCASIFIFIFASHSFWGRLLLCHLVFAFISFANANIVLSLDSAETRGRGGRRWTSEWWSSALILFIHSLFWLRNFNSVCAFGNYLFCSTFIQLHIFRPPLPQPHALVRIFRCTKHTMRAIIKFSQFLFHSLPRLFSGTVFIQTLFAFFSGMKSVECTHECATFFTIRLKNIPTHGKKAHALRARQWAREKERNENAKRQ